MHAHVEPCRNKWARTGEGEGRREGTESEGNGETRARTMERDDRKVSLRGHDKRREQGREGANRAQRKEHEEHIAKIIFSINLSCKLLSFSWISERLFNGLRINNIEPQSATFFHRKK